MSKGLQDFQNTVGSYTGSSDAITNYIQNYDSAFFQNWKEKVDLASQKLQIAQNLANGLGQLNLGAKSLHQSVKAFKNKFYNNDDKQPGDEDGRELAQQQGDTDPQGGDRSSTGNVDDPEITNMGPGSSEDVGGERGYELQDVNRGPQPSGQAKLSQGELSETSTQQDIMDADPEDQPSGLLGANEATEETAEETAETGEVTAETGEGQKQSQ